MKYTLRFEEICLYEVEAEREEEALKVPVPTFGHRASITIQSNSGYGKKYEIRNQGKTKLIFNNKFLTLEEMKDIMRKMLKNEKDWDCDMLVEHIYKAQEVKNETVVS